MRPFRCPLPTAFFEDLRFGLRLWRHNPGFAAAAMLTLAVGIGATTEIFSVVDAVLLRPLPYRDAARLVLVWDQLPRLGIKRLPTSFDPAAFGIAALVLGAATMAAYLIPGRRAARIDPAVALRGE